MAESTSSDLRTIFPENPLYRIARLPDPWEFPDWAYAGTDGVFENRWDDPQGLYRVLYASSSRLGAFIEVLARFRPDPHVVAALKDIDGEGDAVHAPGELDAGWLRIRCIGLAQPPGVFVDVGHSSSLANLREALAARVVHYRLGDLDAAAIRLSAPRRFTQEISRYIYNQSTPEGQRSFAGIAYGSRLGDEFRNWAIYEESGDAPRWTRESETNEIAEDDPDLLEALKRLGVRLAQC